jgi:hypothetical protein
MITSFCALVSLLCSFSDPLYIPLEKSYKTTPIEKTWKEVEKEELPTMSEGATHNEKFYFLPIANEEA